MTSYPVVGHLCSVQVPYMEETWRHLSFLPLRAWIEDPLQLPLGRELGTDGIQMRPALGSSQL